MITETKREKERLRDQEAEERKIDKEKDGVIGYEGGGGGGDEHVLDLDTTVRCGVLGGVVGVGVGKLDLKKMIEELDLYEVQSVFICPISLEPIQDPVTLCTGNFKWFSLG